MDYEKVEELEKKYFLQIKNAIQNNINLIKERLEFLNKNKDYWRPYLNQDNAIQNVIQEIVRSVVFRNFNWKPYSLPICSDTSFETEDAIINLDIKTVKEIDNDAKQGYLQIRPNQVSYPNSDVKGIPWIQHQPPVLKGLFNNKLLTLSYFVKFIWGRRGSDIYLKELVICSIPNFYLSKIYGKNFIVNYKTYDVSLDKKASDDDMEMIKDKHVSNWQSEGWYFIKLRESTIWGKNKKPTKKYGIYWHKIKSGGTARFNIKAMKYPKLTKDWYRLEELEIR